MASFKVSGLNQVTSTNDESLLLISYTSDGGASYNSRKIKISDFFQEQTDLRTLTGLAAGATDLGVFSGNIIQDNANLKNALQSIEDKIEENDQAGAKASALLEVDGNVNDLITLSGVGENVTNLGSFEGTTISGNTTVKQALQDLETAHEETDTNVDDLVTLSGVAENATDLGTFTGSTIGANKTVKGALQALETGLASEASSRASAVSAEATARSNADANLQNQITSNDTQLASLQTLLGYTAGSQHLGEFSGSVISDDTDVKNALQELEAALETEAASRAAAIVQEVSDRDAAISVAVTNLVNGSPQLLDTLDELAQAIGDDSNFVNTITTSISSEASARAAADATLQANIDALQISSLTDGANVVQAGQNLNRLVANTAAATVPQDNSGNDNYLFIVVDRNDGSVKCIDKTFVEVE
jgi:hypothetical protein